MPTTRLCASRCGVAFVQLARHICTARLNAIALIGAILACLERRAPCAQSCWLCLVAPLLVLAVRGSNGPPKLPRRHASRASLRGDVCEWPTTSSPLAWGDAAWRHCDESKAQCGCRVPFFLSFRVRVVTWSVVRAGPLWRGARARVSRAPARRAPRLECGQGRRRLAARRPPGSGATGTGPPLRGWGALDCPPSGTRCHPRLIVHSVNVYLKHKQAFHNSSNGAGPRRRRPTPTPRRRPRGPRRGARVPVAARALSVLLSRACRVHNTSSRPSLHALDVASPQKATTSNARHHRPMQTR